MVKKILYLFCALFFSPFCLAGQGMYLKIKSYVPNVQAVVMDSHCVNGIEDIRVNHSAYLEASNGCLNDWLKFSIRQNGKSLVNFETGISYNGSALKHQGMIHANNLVIAATLYPHSGILGTQDEIVISIDKPQDDWMKQSSVSIAKKPLRALILPGSHDTGTQGISLQSEITADMDANLKFWLNLDPLKMQHLKNWSKTQNLRVEEQLNAGIRYLDLRLCKSAKKELITCHGISGLSLDKILKDVAVFLNDKRHDNEILILDINHLYDINVKDIEKLAAQLNHYLADKIASRSEFSPNSLVMDFWNKHKQVIILINDSRAIKLYPQIFWSQANIYSPWPNKQDTQDLIKSLSTILKQDDRYFTNKFFVLQTQETPSSKTIIDGFNPFSHNPDSLLKMTSQYKLQIENWLREDAIQNKIKHKGSIIIEDFSNGIDLTEMAKSLN